ncbi:MAG: FHA domain-containing protein [Caldilineaceae bacterium]
MVKSLILSSRFVLNIGALLLVMCVLLAPATSYAQDDEATFLNLLRVDTTNPPMVDLWLYSDQLPADGKAAKLSLSENGEEQALTGDLVEPSALQLGVVIDPWQINANGVAGQPAFNHVASTLRTLVEKPTSAQILVRLQDQVAAFSIQPDDSLQVIQDWSNEPNLLYNGVVLTPVSDGARADQLTALLLQAMTKFASAKTDNQTVKSLLLFANAASQVDLESVVAQANQQSIHIQVINLSGEAAPSPMLQQLAQATHGHYVDFVPDAEPITIWNSLLAYHSQRHVVYLSDGATERQINISLQVDTQTTLTQSVSLPAATADAAGQNNAVPMAAGAKREVPTAVATPTAQAPAATPATAASQAAAETPVETTVKTTVTQANSEGKADAANASEPTAVVAQSAQALPANNAQPVASPIPTMVTTYINIPILGFAVPRGLLLLALPILLILLFFLIYRESRDRSKKRPGEYQLAALKKPDAKFSTGKFTVNQDLKLRAKNQGLQNNQTEQSVPLRPLADEQRAKSNREQPATEAKPNPFSAPRNVSGREDPDARENAPALRRPFTNGNRTVERPQALPTENLDEEDDLATVASLNFSDDEATFRLRESVEQPIIGKLVRVSNNPHLPQQLPIYGLNPAAGQSRQIHVGRHSKNNTVVISDKSVSREHAVLIQKEGRLYLRDNGSSAGTYLNWRRLQPGEELLLRHNDLIGFGEVSYEFQAKGEDEATISNP